MPDPNITILHVDDDRAVTELVVEIVKRRFDDLTVITAQNGEEALATLEGRDDVDCVVSDFKMPRLDGLELLRAVRERWPDLPFILFTGQGSDEVAEQAIDAGATEYLQKRPDPNSYLLLPNRVRTLVDRSRAEARFERRTRQTEVQFGVKVDTVED